MAILIDGAILGFAYLFVVLIIAAATGHHAKPTSHSKPAAAGAVIAGTIFGWILISIPAAVYYGAMNGSRRGQTVGKLALGISVRDARTGTPIGFWRGLGRFLMTDVFMICLYVPYIIDSLAPLWDSRRQSWHDKVAHTVVVDLKP